MDSRELRLAQNETIFREINERVREVAEQHGGDPHVYTFFCECANSDCTLQIPLTTADYERVRRDGAQFVVAPGHDLPDVEVVVAEGDGWSIVAKEGDAARYARGVDPRGRDKL